MLISMYCTNCGNQVTTAAAITCPYCEKPLPISAPARKSLKSCFVVISLIVMIGGFVIAAFLIFPDLKDLLKLPAQKDEPKVEKVKRTAQSDKEALDALYNRYLHVLQNPQPENFREFVQRKD
jgi:hypothetical protein